MRENRCGRRPAAVALATVWFGLAVTMSPAEKVATDAGTGAGAVTPAAKVLAGEDAKRVEALDRKIRELRQAGKFAEAIEPARTIVEIYTRVQGTHHWQTKDAVQALRSLEAIAALPTPSQQGLAEAARLEVETYRLDQHGRYSEALPLVRRALSIRQQYLGAEESETVRLLSELAHLLARSGRHAEAQPLYQKALNIRRKVLGEEHPDTAASYNNVAYNLNAQGRYAEAQPLFQKALDIKRKVLGEDHPETATSYNNVAYNLNAQGRYAEAQALYQKALDIQRKVLGEYHPDTARSYDNMARNLDDQGRYAEAQPLFQKALDLRRKVVGDHHPDTAASYNNSAGNLDAQGRYAEAQPLFLKALDIDRNVLGEEHPDTAKDYNGLALNLNAQGRYAEAQPLFQKALDIDRKVLGEEHPHTALGYNNVAYNLDAQGREAEAQPLFQKALDICRKLLGEKHPDTANGYNNLALNLTAQGRHADAEPLYQKALEIYRNVLGEEHPDTANGYNSLALDLNAQGRYAEAQPLFQKALDIQRKVLGEEHPDTATTYNNLAANLSAQGHFAEAQPFFQKALHIRRQVLGEEHPDTANGYNNTACNLRVQGRYTEAETLFRRAVQGFEVARLRSGVSGLERASFAARSPLPGLIICLAHNGKAHDAWQTLDASLARGLLDDASARLVEPISEDQHRRQEHLSRELATLEKQIAPLLGAKEAQQVRRFQELTRQRSVVEGGLARLAAELAEKEVYELKRIQAQLSPESALVAWIDIQGQPKAADPNGQHWGCVLRQHGEPVWVRLPGSGPHSAWTKDDDELPPRFRIALNNSRDDGSATTGQLKHRLAAQRLEPLTHALKPNDELPAATHLICLSAWWMAGVPLEALTDRYTISYAPSGTLYAKLREQRQSAHQSNAPPSLLAIGDPVFPALERASQPEPPPPDHGILLNQVVSGSNAQRSGLHVGDVLLSYGGKALARPADLSAGIAQAVASSQLTKAAIPVEVWRDGQRLTLQVGSGRLGVQSNLRPAAEAILAKRDGDRAIRASRGGRFEPLPGTRHEVDAIATLFPEAVVLLGSDASEQRLDELANKGELKRFRYLHVATHGVMNDRIAMQSALIVSQDHLPDAAQQVLAGKPVYDGRLTAEKVLKRWKLDADLVTLSACQSGLGKNAGGEGYLGFSQALFLAGARSLVVSLWKVDDQATALLMQRFYQNLLGKRADLKGPMPKAMALREAKEWLRSLTREQIGKEQVAMVRGSVREMRHGPASAPAVDHAYAEPYYWAAFILIGDPE